MMASGDATDVVDGEMFLHTRCFRSFKSSTTMAGDDATLQIAWELSNDACGDKTDATLQITRELCNDNMQKNFLFFFLLDVALGLVIFESLQGFLRLSLCTTNDNPRDIH
jgi:hypothetical protein